MLQYPSYSLAKTSKKYPCPRCHKKRFVPYVNMDTNEILNLHVGRCDREVKCGYHMKPKEYFQNSSTTRLNNTKQSISYTLPSKYVDLSLKQYNKNSFVAFLNNHFNKEVVEERLFNYKVGTSKRWKGATVFWQIDRFNRIRTGKIMQYDAHTGKRIKEPYTKIDWVHNVLKKEKQLPTTFELKQCLFGEHLVVQQESLNKPVAIVESEKTAIIMAITYPKYVWLACGSLSNININLFQPIKTKEIILFPDKGCFNKWKSKSTLLLNVGFKITTANVLEQFTLPNGSDLADLFLYKSIDSNLFQTIKNKPKPIQHESLTTLIEKNPTIDYLIKKFDLTVE